MARVVPYMGLAKKKLIVNSFFAAPLNYHSLIWIILIAILITTELNRLKMSLIDMWW